MSMDDVSSVMHPISEYKTSKHGAIYTNIICKDKNKRDDQIMVGSCGADVSVVASCVGWIRTLASVLVVSLGGIVSSTGALSWSYGI